MNNKNRRSNLKLNIIGNGFDLYHGLPSSYYFFGCYLINNDCEFYETMCKMYNSIFGRGIGPSIAHEYEYVVEDIFWKNFETRLGYVDESFIVDTYETDLGLENSDPIDIEMSEDIIAERIKEFFIKWVKNTLDKDENYELIFNKMKRVKDIFDFDKDDYFLVFNYTHVLQKMYNIPDEKICYVHGECLGKDDDNLIIGHGNIDRIKEIKKVIKKLKIKDDYTQETSNNINEYSCLLRFLERLQKDVDMCKDECESFYRSINNEIKKVRIYGMSLGNVDIPYIKQIKNIWPNAEWEFSYYTNEDRETAIEVAENILKINKDKYTLFKFENEISYEIQEEIIDFQKITTYHKL